MKTLFSILVFFSFFCTSAQNSQDTLSIYFDFNASELDDAANEKLLEFNTSEHGDIVMIVAHCDTSGTILYNIELSQKRLSTVVNAIDSSAVSTVAQGEKISSKAKNYDAAFYRRVDVIYYSKQNIENLPWDQQFDLFMGDSTMNHTFIDVNILFFEGEAIMKQSSYYDIDRLYQYMKNNPNIHLHIHGHVCCGHNYVLSKNRAHAVYMYLLERKISYKRLRYTGHSNSQPKIMPEDTTERKDANRRVSLEVTKH